MSTKYEHEMDGAFEILKATKDRVETQAEDSVMPAGFTIPTLDISDDTSRQVVIDRQEDVYLGHTTTAMLDDGKTIFAVYTKGHGVGQWVLKKSTDAGLTWSDRLPVPFGWSTCASTPNIYKLYDKQGKRRLFVFAAGFPLRSSVSEDDGETWRDLAPLGNFGGMDPFTSIVEVGKGEYVALYHDNGVFLSGDNRLMQIWHTGEGYDARSKALWCARDASGEWGPTVRYGCKPVLERPDDHWELIHCYPLGNPFPDKATRVFSCRTTDGGLTWSEPKLVAVHPHAQLMEAGMIKSPDGKQIFCIMRSESRTYNSFGMVSNDNGETWSELFEMPAAVTGDRHELRYLKDGRIFISFRDMALRTETKGDWIGWVGTYDDLINRREGQYRVRLMKNNECDCGYSGVEILPDGTVVASTYGEFDAGKPNYIVSVRFKPEELDAML